MGAHQDLDWAELITGSGVPHGERALKTTRPVKTESIVSLQHNKHVSEVAGWLESKSIPSNHS